MKKAILVLLVGLFWCNVGISAVEKFGVIALEDDWRRYKELDKKYNIKFKAFGISITSASDRSRWSAVKSGSSETLEDVLNFIHSHSDCRSGCIIVDINNRETTFSEQIDIAKKYNSAKLAPRIIKKIKELEKRTDKSIESTPNDNKVVAASMGSGFFVTRAGHLVTNYHVIEECDSVKVSFNSKEIQADTIAIDKFNDLAIIKAKINPTKVFPVSNEDVSLLEDIIVAGFPLGKKVSAAIKTHKGSVTALAGYEDNYSNFQTDATINQGNSGGPIINQKGNVVGVAVATWVEEGVQGIHFGVKSSTLKTFASANGIIFLPPNSREMSNADLGKLITEGTVFLECWMTVAKIKQMIAQAENRKAFYSEHK